MDEIRQMEAKYNEITKPIRVQQNRKQCKSNNKEREIYLNDLFKKSKFIR